MAAGNLGFLRPRHYDGDADEPVLFFKGLVGSVLPNGNAVFPVEFIHQVFFIVTVDAGCDCQALRGARKSVGVFDLAELFSRLYMEFLI